MPKNHNKDIPMLDTIFFFSLGIVLFPAVLLFMFGNALSRTSVRKWIGLSVYFFVMVWVIQNTKLGGEVWQKDTTWATCKASPKCVSGIKDYVQRFNDKQTLSYVEAFKK